MRTALIVLILGLAATSVMSACAANNWATDLITFPSGDLETTGNGNAATAAGAKCGWTTSSMICAKAGKEGDYITAVENYIKAERTKLEDAAGDRDQYFLDQRGEVIKILGTLREIGDLADSKSIPSGNAATMVTLFDGFVTSITKNFTALVANLEAYQKARATCIQDLLKTEAAILCEAALATPGTTYAATITTQVPIDDVLLKKLTTTCSDYIQYGATQSAIVYANLYSKTLSAVLTALKSGSASDFTAAITEYGKVTTSSAAADNYKLPSKVPTDCTTSVTSDACVDWYETAWFGTDGQLNNAKIITGGDTALVTFSRRLEENPRRLAATGLNPDLTKITFDFTFKENPGAIDNTKNANSALRNSIVACAVAALALVF